VKPAAAQSHTFKSISELGYLYTVAEYRNQNRMTGMYFSAWSSEQWKSCCLVAPLTEVAQFAEHPDPLAFLSLPILSFCQMGCHVQQPTKKKLGRD
jgi:hypothetical protein